MKKIAHYFVFIYIFISVFLMSACTTDTTTNLAKDLDTTVSNLLVAVSSLDWPDDSTLDSFNSISENPIEPTSSQVVDTQIDTSEIYIWLETVHSKVNLLFSKRSDLLMYLNEIYGGNTSLSEEDILSLNVYMNILKDNSNYLSSYNGMLINQLNEAKEIFDSNANLNLINAYLIKAVETLQVRCAKIDTSILAMTSIIDIIKNNLVNNYYSYNEHKIEEINEPEITDTPIDNEEPSQPEQEDNPIAVQPEEEIPQEEVIEEENAINFDGEVSEVETNQEEPPIPVQTDLDPIEPDNNSNDEIMTLEEPIIDDEPIDDSAMATTKDIKKIDKDFTEDIEQNLQEDEIVTREIIKEKIIKKVPKFGTFFMSYFFLTFVIFLIRF